MQVGFSSSFYSELGIEFGKKDFFQKYIGFRNGRDIGFSQFLHQSILKGTIHSFDSSFSLRRIRKDELNAEFLSYLSKLCLEILVISGIGMVDLVGGKVIEIEGLRFSETRIGDVFSPETKGSPYPFIDIKSCCDFSSSIIHPNEETGFSCSIFKPEVVGSIILYHFSIVWFSFPFHPLSIWSFLLLDLADFSANELIADSGHRYGDVVLFF
jgi:hypothetical protein